MIESYDKLSIGKYLKFREMLKQEMPEEELQAELIALLNDMSINDVMGMSLVDYSKCVRKLEFLTVKPEQKDECPRHIVLGDTKYDVVRKIEELTVAQYIDYQTYMKIDDPDGKLAEILSIFIVPSGKKYAEDYDIAEVINDIREYLPVTVAFNLCFFFRKKQLGYIKRILIYLGLMMKIWKRKTVTEKQKKMMIEAETQMKMLQDFLTSGGGLTM